jgi:predicted RNA-binding Zn-ribbon protein involved in translation (DUF1610 family)
MGNSVTAAKMVANLPEILKGYGHILKKSGTGFYIRSCPVCGDGSKVSNRLSIFRGRDRGWRYKCHSCGVSGSAVDWLIFENGYDIWDAVHEINGTTPPQQAGNIVHHSPAIVAAEIDAKTETKNAAMRRVVGVLRACGYTTALSYLTGRGIASEVVIEGHRRGLLCSLPDDSTKAQNALMQFAGNDLAATEYSWGGAYHRPMIFVHGSRSIECRSVRAESSGPRFIRYGTIDRPWLWQGLDQSRILITEGCIDALSVVTMGWTGSVLALPGANAEVNPAWLKDLHQQHGCAFYIGLDSDKAGTTGSEKILAVAASAGVPVRKIAPGTTGETKDWNDVLKAGMVFCWAGSDQQITQKQARGEEKRWADLAGHPAVCA